MDGTGILSTPDPTWKQEEKKDKIEQPLTQPKETCQSLVLLEYHAFEFTESGVIRK